MNKIYYHVTKKGNEKSILKKGLISSYSGRVSNLSLPGSVYFTTDLDKFFYYYSEFDKGDFVIFKIKDSSSYKYFFYDDFNEPLLVGYCYYTQVDVDPNDLEVFGYSNNGRVSCKY